MAFTRFPSELVPASVDHFMAGHFVRAAFSGGDSVPPDVAVVSPAPGSIISASTPLVVDVTDDSGQLRRAILAVDLAGLQLEEIAHNGDRFGPRYQGSTNSVAAIANGFRYTLLRDGGWPAAPTLWAEALDTSGNENA